MVTFERANTAELLGSEMLNNFSFYQAMLFVSPGLADFYHMSCSIWDKLTLVPISKTSTVTTDMNTLCFTGLRHLLDIIHVEKSTCLSSMPRTVLEMV